MQQGKALRRQVIECHVMRALILGAKRIASGKYSTYCFAASRVYNHPNRRLNAWESCRRPNMKYESQKLCSDYIQEGSMHIWCDPINPDRKNQRSLPEKSKDNRDPNARECRLQSDCANWSNITKHFKDLFDDAGPDFQREENNRIHLRFDREAIMHQMAD